MRKSVLVAGMLVAWSAPPAAAAPRCADAAVAQAARLLRFHLGEAANTLQIAGGRRARGAGMVSTSRGKGRLDVLEVISDVYKAKYRMRLTYARIPGSCALMGQEIVEIGNPY